MDSFRFDEKYLSQIPALQVLVNLGYQYLTPAEALDLTRSAFAWMAEYEGEIPGASAVECGNYLMMDPIAARAEAAAMLPVLEGLDAEKLHY